MSWFYLALLAPLLFAVVNLIDDSLVQNIETGPKFVAIVAGVFGALPLLSRLFIHASNIPTNLALLAVLAGVLTVSYYFFYLKALLVESPSVVIAMFSLSPATLPFLAHFIIGERLIAAQILGLIIVLLGSLALSINREEKMNISKAVVPMLVAVALLDALSLISKYTYDRASFYPVYLYVSAGMGLGGLLFLTSAMTSKSNEVTKTLKQVIRKFAALFIMAEVFSLSAEFVQNLAISRGPVSLIRVIESVQPVFVLLIALALYPIFPKHFREAKEGNIRQKLLLMAVICVGLYLIQRSSSL